MPRKKASEKTPDLANLVEEQNPVGEENLDPSDIKTPEVKQDESKVEKTPEETPDIKQQEIDKSTEPKEKAFDEFSKESRDNVGIKPAKPLTPRQVYLKNYFKESLLRIDTQIRRSSDMELKRKEESLKKISELGVLIDLSIDIGNNTK